MKTLTEIKMKPSLTEPNEVFTLSVMDFLVLYKLFFMMAANGACADGVLGIYIFL